MEWQVGGEVEKGAGRVGVEGRRWRRDVADERFAPIDPTADPIRLRYFEMVGRAGYW